MSATRSQARSDISIMARGRKALELGPTFGLPAPVCFCQMERTRNVHAQSPAHLLEGAVSWVFRCYVRLVAWASAVANPGRDRSQVSSVAVRQMRKNPGVSNIAPGMTRIF